MKDREILELVEEEVKKILGLLGVGNMVNVTLGDGEEGTLVLNVDIEGDDLGYMIGNRGRHMQAFQYVVSSIVKKKVREKDAEKKIAVVLDISGYRRQRVEKLEKLALQKADDARILGDSVDLPPMSPGERRVIHTTLSQFDDIKTESQGEDRERFVRIIPISEKEIGITEETGDNTEESEEEQE